MSKETLISDMDGVITDTEPLHQQADKHVCAEYGICIPADCWDSFKGTAGRDMFTYILRTFTDGTLSVSVDELVLAKRKRYLEIAREKMTLIPGAIEFIHYARKRVPKMGLVTSSGREVADLVCKTYGISPYFDIVITGNDITKGKPNPEPYLLALAKLGTCGSSAWVIEDSTNGILSAKSAGCNVIGITTSFPKEALEKSGADIIVDSFTEIYSLFP